MVGGEGSKISDLDALGISLKTVRLNNGLAPKDSMSFPAMDYCKIAKEDWESSETKKIFTKRFLFMFFNVTENNEEIFEKAVFWSLTDEDLDTVRKIWRDTQLKILNGNYEDFCKQKDGLIVHIRPHGRNSKDYCKGPEGLLHVKKSFWLSREYLYFVYKSK